MFEHTLLDLFWVYCAFESCEHLGDLKASRRKPTGMIKTYILFLCSFSSLLINNICMKAKSQVFRTSLAPTVPSPPGSLIFVCSSTVNCHGEEDEDAANRRLRFPHLWCRLRCLFLFEVFSLKAGRRRGDGTGSQSTDETQIKVSKYPRNGRERGERNVEHLTPYQKSFSSEAAHTDAEWRPTIPCHLSLLL